MNCEHEWAPIPVLNLSGHTVAWVYRCKCCGEPGYEVPAPRMRVVA